MAEDVVAVLLLQGSNIIQTWRMLMGPTNSEIAKSTHPESIRANYGTNSTRNAVHGSDSNDSAKREIAFFFPDSVPNPFPSAINSHCALLVVKPMAVGSSIGFVISRLLDSDIEISAIDTVTMDIRQASALFQLYSAPYPVHEWILELQSGPSVVIQVRGVDIVKKLRDLVGPVDPEQAKIVFPESLRAKFGLNLVKNALHCTDLDEDGIRDCCLFFDN